MKHTPGEWSAKFVKETEGTHAGRVYRYIVADDPTDYLAEVFSSRSPDVARANAYLMGASKKLLELAKAVDLHFRKQFAPDYSYYSQEECDLHARAKAAIAKAAGDQP